MRKNQFFWVIILFEDLSDWTYCNNGVKEREIYCNVLSCKGCDKKWKERKKKIKKVKKSKKIKKSKNW